MFRTLIFSVLLAAFFGQGWAQAGMSASMAPASHADCAEHMDPDTGCDCCPDGAAAAGGCAALCAVAIALTSALPEVALGRTPLDSTFFLPDRAGPRYLPLNPPPIA